jgi:hypothetical protein
MMPGTHLFQVTVTDDRGAIAIARIKVTVLARTLALVRANASTLNIYAGDGLTSPFYLSVYDRAGKLLKQQKLVNQGLTEAFTISIESLRSGVYFISLTDASGRNLSQAFLKQ